MFAVKVFSFVGDWLCLLCIEGFFQLLIMLLALHLLQSTGVNMTGVLNFVRFTLLRMWWNLLDSTVLSQSQFGFNVICN